MLLFNRGRIERLKDPAHASSSLLFNVFVHLSLIDRSLVVSEIVRRANCEDLMLLYNLPAFTKGDSNAFLATVARANNYIKKVF